MMPKSDRIRLVRPSAVIINHKKWVYRVTSYRVYRAAWHFWPIPISKIAKKLFIEHFFLTGDYNTKSQKSKKLPGKSKFYKVPHKHDAWNCKNSRAWASAAIITNKK
jgi:hypothetical protein